MAPHVAALIGLSCAGIFCSVLGGIQVAMAARRLAMRQPPATLYALNATAARVSDKLARAEASARSLDDLAARAEHAMASLSESQARFQRVGGSVRTALRSVAVEAGRLINALR